MERWWANCVGNLAIKAAGTLYQHAQGAAKARKPHPVTSVLSAEQVTPAHNGAHGLSVSEPHAPSTSAPFVSPFLKPNSAWAWGLTVGGGGGEGEGAGLGLGAGSGLGDGSGSGDGDGLGTTGDGLGSASSSSRRCNDEAGPTGAAVPHHLHAT